MNQNKVSSIPAISIKDLKDHNKGMGKADAGGILPDDPTADP